MGNSGARLADIAARTGYSKNTVSLALRDSPRIPEATRDLIRTAARELNYLPNHVAKSLTSRETKTIGLVLADITNPILTETSRMIEKELAKLGYGTLFATSNNTRREEVAAIEMFRSRQVDGMLIYPARGDRNFEHLIKLRRANFPVVLLTCGEDIGVDMVGVDEKVGVYKAVRHFIDLGHRRIAAVHGDLAGGLEDGARLHAADLRIGDRKTASAMAQHRVAFRQFQRPLACGFRRNAGGGGHIGKLLGRMRQELMKRRVQKTDRHRKACHDGEQLFEILPLHRQQLGQRDLAAGAQATQEGGLAHWDQVTAPAG